MKKPNELKQTEPKPGSIIPDDSNGWQWWHVIVLALAFTGLSFWTSYTCYTAREANERAFNAEMYILKHDKDASFPDVKVSIFGTNRIDKCYGMKTNERGYITNMFDYETNCAILVTNYSK